MEAAFGKVAPVARRIMQQTGNDTDNAVELKSSRLPCRDWRVDAAVWIEIRGAQDFEIGATRRRRGRSWAGDADPAFGRHAGGFFCY